MTTIRIALAQQSARPEISDNLERALQAMDTAAEAGCGLMAFP